MRVTFLLWMLFCLLSAPLRAEEPIPVEAFARLPQYDQPQISPDGRFFSYLYPIAGRTHLIVQPANPQEGDAPTVLPPIGESDYLWYRWTSASRLLASLAFESGARGVNTMETRLIGIDADGENVVLMVRPDPRNDRGLRRLRRGISFAQLQDQVIDFLPDEEHHILLAVDDNQDASAEIRKVDVRDASFSRVGGGRDGIQAWMSDASGEVRYGWGHYARGGARAGIYRMPEGNWVRVDQTDWFERGFRPGGFATNPRHAYAIGPVDGGRQGVVLLDMVDGEIEEVLFADERYDANHLVRDPVTREVVGVEYHTERPQVRYFVEDWQVLQDSVDHVFPETINRIVSMTPDRDLLLVMTSSDREPGALYAWDRANRSMSPLVRTQRDIRPEQMASMRPVTFDARDGTPIEGYLTRPAREESEDSAEAPAPGPAVVMPHGGPHARDTWRYDYWAQFLANRGYSVLQPNFRGSFGYGESFREAGEGQWGGLMQDDVTDAARWMIEEGMADPERLCIVGASYGGYAALMGAVKTPDLYRCAVSINGVTDLLQLRLENSRFIGGSEWNRSIALEGEGRREISPHHRADEIEIPVLLVQAEDDWRVPADHAEDMERRLRRNGADVTLVMLEDGGHSLNTEASRLGMLRALETFLAQHLGER